MHNTTITQIFPLICRLDKFMLATESQSQSADFGQSEFTDFIENYSVLWTETFF